MGNRDERQDDATKPSLPRAGEHFTLTPRLREWALQQHTDEELLDGFQELQEHGGTELGDVIQKLKDKRKNRERAKP